MKKVIIGIHGLNNKVGKDILCQWWKICLHQALRNAGMKNLPLNFELIYWADLLYPFPLDPSIIDDTDPRYLAFPFKYLPPGRIEKSDGFTLRRVTRNGIEKITDFLMKSDSIFNNLEELSEKFIRHHFRDLDIYLNNGTGYKEAQTQSVRQTIINRVHNSIQRNKSKKIMIIAHSMGSIITFDVLHSLSRGIEIDTLVTLGSPLGQSTIMGKLMGQNPAKEKLKTPENVRHWYNLSDIRDIITINYNLGDDFVPNSENIRPHDLLVNNNYNWEKKSNPHSIFGYLQTPQCGRILFDFLDRGLSPMELNIQSFFQSFMDNVLKCESRILEKIPGRSEQDLEKDRTAETREDKIKEQLQS